MKQLNIREVQIINEKLQAIDPAFLASSPQLCYETERWRPISGYENLYMVSSFGRVKSLPRTCIRGGKKINSHGGRLLILNNGTRGYKLVALCKNGKCTTKKVHRLVAEAFIPNNNNLPQINHIDLNKANNSLANLEWIDGLLNMRHAFANGVHRNRMNRLTKRARSVIAVNRHQQNIGPFGSINIAARSLGISPSRIYDSIRENRFVGKYKFLIA